MDFEAFKELASRQRAVRTYDTSRGVDEATIEELLRVATFAPNGGNRQPWRFVVVRDADQRAKLGKIYGELVESYLGTAAHGQTPWKEIPVLIAVCSEAMLPSGRVPSGSSPMPASIFPAAQNLMLAAHALGLGSVLTTLWKVREADVKAVLGLPDEMEVHVILPIGWPDRKYGRNKRRPIAEVAYRDRYGQSW
jgi:nitroreductase